MSEHVLKPCAGCLMLVGFGNKSIVRLLGIPKTTLGRLRRRLGVKARHRKPINLKHVLKAYPQKPKQQPKPETKPSLWDWTYHHEPGWQPVKAVLNGNGQYEMFGQTGTNTSETAFESTVEVWKQISRFPDYECSSLGRIRNRKTGTVLKGHIPRHGYVMVTLNQRTILAHRVIAEAFLPNPSGLPVVNHKDKDRSNNKPSNLEWCTQQHNVRHGFRH